MTKPHFPVNLTQMLSIRSFEKGETEKLVLPGCVGMKRLKAAFVVVLCTVEVDATAFPFRKNEGRERKKVPYYSIWSNAFRYVHT